MNNVPNVNPEKLRFVQRDTRIHDEQIKTKSIGYFQDAWLRFRRNKSAVVAFILIIILVLFAVIVPFVSEFDVSFRSGYYKTVLPRNPAFVGTGFWDGGRRETNNQDSYDSLRAIGMETGRDIIMKEYKVYQDAQGLTYHDVRVDTYYRVGFAYVNLTAEEYKKLQAYQNETGIQVAYPLANNHSTTYLLGNGGANFWYKLRNESTTSTGAPVLDESGNPIANYLIVNDPHRADYDSLRIEGDNGGESGNEWYAYAAKNQSGYRLRVDYYEYFRYLYGEVPAFLFGTNAYGQDIFVCLAAGARLSFLLAIVVSAINFLIGGIYGAIEGY
ncbi:MAG: hypothetical protein IJI38_11655, partial [Clostridia bacterium]|nr:hypothetical protein [Clostridia bacterium]